MFPRLLSGRQIINIGHETFYIRSATLEEKLAANEYYQYILEESKFEGILYKDDLMQEYIRKGLLDADYEKKLKDFRTTIENIKIELYQNNHKSKACTDLRAKLNKVRDAQSLYAGRIAKLGSFSLEALAMSHQAKMLFINTCVRSDGSPVFTEELDHYLYNKVSYAISKTTLSDQDLRAFSRYSSWRTLWNNHKYDAFENKLYELNEEQKSVGFFSQFYDYVYEHPERPADSIIEDDDMVDGWQLLRAAESREEAQRDRVEEIVKNKDPKWQETFLPAANQEEANEIYKLNSPDAKRIVKSRQQLIQQKGTVREKDFYDVKEKMNRRGTEQFKNKFRK